MIKIDLLPVIENDLNTVPKTVEQELTQQLNNVIVIPT
jgi:hypothetical protein